MKQSAERRAGRQAGKLRLSKETLRTLVPDELARAQGGLTPTIIISIIKCGDWSIVGCPQCW